MAWSSPRTWVAGETLTAALLNTHLRDNLNAAFPVGSLQLFMQASTTVETTINGGWLECNGVAVSRTTYSSLHATLSGLSYPFGSGNGSTTFNLPDLRGRSLVMPAGSGGHADVNALGDSDGVALASRTPRVPSHTHTVPSHTHGGGGLGVSLSFSTGAVFDSGSTPYVRSDIAGDVTGSTDSGGSGSSGSGGSHPSAYLVAGVWGVKF